MKAQEIAFNSLQENIETVTESGKLVFHIFAALADFERGIIQERTRAGLAAARARGRVGGRKGIDPQKIALIQQLSSDRNTSPASICEHLGISRSTFYKYASNCQSETPVVLQSKQPATRKSGTKRK